VDDVLQTESSGASSSSFVYNPQNPLYSFKFVEDLVDQYKPQNPKAVESPELICCPRAYEDMFLREPVNDERACINDSACQGLFIPCETPFILREFYYPDDNSQTVSHGMCLMCRRYEIARQFFRNCSTDREISPAVHISRYYNIVNVPGEYDTKDCIMNKTQHCGLVMPVVLHMRTAYELCTVDGVRYYRQTHYSDNTNKGTETPAFLCKGAILRARGGTAL